MSLLRPTKMDSWNIFSKKFWTFDNLFGKSKRELFEEKQLQEKKLEQKRQFERLINKREALLCDAHEVISKLNEKNINDDIPICFRDPITFELMTNPVITPLGNVYDKDSLEACMRHQSRDPLTNTRLNVSDIKPFPALKKMIDIFTNKKSEIQHCIQPTYNTVCTKTIQPVTHCVENTALNIQVLPSIINSTTSMISSMLSFGLWRPSNSTIQNTTANSLRN